MTALCGGGTSGPKLLPELAATYSAGRLAQLLVAGGLSELSAWLPLVAGVPVVFSSFCATDPPAMVALTRAESDALAKLDFGTDFFNGLTKFTNVMLNLIWNDACQCTSGTFTPATVPARDVNTPVYVPPAPTVATPCLTLSVVDSANLNTANPAFSGATQPIRVYATAFRVTYTGSLVLAPGRNVNVDFSQKNAAGTIIRTDTVTITSGMAATPVVFPVTPGMDSIIVSGQRVAGTGTDRVTVLVEVYCNGAPPGGTLQPCCPPDPATQAYLDLILRQVTLLQRQLAPFAYVTRTVYAGLTGTGNIEVQGLLGVSVSLTTVPAWLGQIGGTPVELFDAGFVTFGVDDGYTSSFRVTHPTEVFLPPRASAFTDLGYTFPPGVVASVTELVREP